ncbi:MAG: hypothetical protein Q7W45_02085 [Bacteroidota bacterium]|nr:hypothetical protein [Bacteroidota bacterium]MDP3145676.1 hypothetical protein [Bacteroidota bacterium]MDP3558649.1 hypothetical protein [Bacteroidota bacterium]
MKNLIPERFAILGLITLLSIFLTFHILVMLGIIPFEIVWGGRLKNKTEMIKFEIVSVLINLTMLSVVLIRASFIKLPINNTLIKIILWIMFGLFLLNTLGNLFSLNEFERNVFTPITLVLSLFSLRLAISK